MKKLFFLLFTISILCRSSFVTNISAGKSAHSKINTTFCRNSCSFFAFLAIFLKPIVGESLCDIFNPTTVITGFKHSCALSSNSEVKCWGSNWDGELGYGDINHRGDDPNEMGDNLPIVDLGKGFIPAAISLGDYTCALSRGGKVKCWGSNGFGQLGYGDKRYRGNKVKQRGEKKRGRLKERFIFRGGHLADKLY